MRVILRENIENLGKKGDIVKVTAGYGRNYLIPKKMAIEVTPTNAKMIAIEQAVLQKGLEQEISTYKELAQQLNQVSLSFTRKTSEKDVIFGSVSSTDIRDELERLGFHIDKKKIALDEPIKKLGNYTVTVKIFHEERAEIKIRVVKEGAPSSEHEAEDALVPKEEEETVTSGESESVEVPAEDSSETVPEERPAERKGTEKSMESGKDSGQEKQEEVPAEEPSDKTAEEDKDKGE